VALFRDRADAGRKLGAALRDLRTETVGRGRIVVLGLPRGGVPVAAAVAAALDAPLDVIVVRKVGAPGQPELAIGAVGEGGVRVRNEVARALVGANDAVARAIEAREAEEAERRAARFRGGMARRSLRGATAIIVDDGIATGASARAACAVARADGASRVVLAMPVAPRHSAEELLDAADEVICLANPVQFYAVGQFYADFAPLRDEEVVACLEIAAARRAAR
jgi:putative phosphoribosyl transferase